MATIVRGCGTRTEGGIYAEVRLSRGGMPLDSFLIDPPKPCDMEAMGMSAVGVKFFEQSVTGLGEETTITTHILDYVGMDSYPNVADFIEEARKFGVSRKLSPTLDFSKLGPGSRIMLVHKKAIIENRDEYYDEIPTWGCPKNLSAHESHDNMGDKRRPNQMCLALCYQDIVNFDDFIADEPRGVRRVLPSGISYLAHHAPIGVTADYAPGFFLSLPITNLAIIRGRDGEHNAAHEATNGTRLPVLLEDS